MITTHQNDWDHDHNEHRHDLDHDHDEHRHDWDHDHNNTIRYSCTEFKDYQYEIQK